MSDLRRYAIALLIYAAAYALGSGLDLWTTLQALTAPGAAEANVFVVEDAAYRPGLAAWLSVGAGLLMLGLVAFSLIYAGRLDDRWLKRPMASFGRFYLNPWSALDRAALHALSYAVAFVILRVLAGLNNLMIVAGQPAPIGGLVRGVGDATSPMAGFALVIGVIYFGLTLAVSPLAARLLSRWRADSGLTAARTASLGR